MRARRQQRRAAAISVRPRVQGLPRLRRIRLRIALRLQAHAHRRGAVYPTFRFCAAVPAGSTATLPSLKSIEGILALQMTVGDM